MPVRIMPRLKVAMFLVLSLIYGSAAAGGKLLKRPLQRNIASIAIAALTFGLQQHAVFAESCSGDCYSNCLQVAPGSEDYCKSTCTDYCNDPEIQREDSEIRAKEKAETGYDRALLNELNRPPVGLQIIPKETMRNLQLNFKPQEPRTGVYFKDFLK